jgi:hypothetical protein
MLDIREHLLQRHCDLELHNPFIGEDCATFLLWSLTGKIVGYQRYRPSGDKMRKNNPKEGRYYTYRSQDKPDVAVFGIETLHNSGPIFVTEGIFDATRISKYRRPVIATLSNDPDSSTKNFLRMLNRPLVAILDSGKSGEPLRKIGDYSVKMESGDLGDAPEEIILQILKDFA